MNPPQSPRIALSNTLFDPSNRHPGPPTSVSRKDGGVVFSFTFWLFMSISVTSLTQSSFSSPVYALLGFRSMVYATFCFVAILVFGQSARSVFLGKYPPHSPFSFFKIAPTFSSYSGRPSPPFVSPIDGDQSEASSLTLFPFQHSSQTLPSRLFAHTSPSNPSDATSLILVTPLTKIRIHLVCTTPRAAPWPRGPIRTPFVPKFISRIVRL